jgi:membrane protein implicated in regulation of membrane protease activity
LIVVAAAVALAALWAALSGHPVAGTVLLIFAGILLFLWWRKRSTNKDPGGA